MLFISINVISVQLTVLYLLLTVTVYLRTYGFFSNGYLSMNTRILLVTKIPRASGTCLKPLMGRNVDKFMKVYRCTPDSRIEELLDKYHRDFVPALNQSTKGS